MKFIYKSVIIFMLLFTKIYLYKICFSTRLTIISKLHNKMIVDSNLRLKSSNAEPDSTTLIATMRFH